MTRKTRPIGLDLRAGGRSRTMERFLLALGLGISAILSSAPGMGAAEPAAAGSPGGGATAAVRVEGQVVDREGRPAAGARWDLRVEAGIAAALMDGNRLAHGQTDDAGRFVAEVAVGGDAWLTATAEGWQGHSESFALERGTKAIGVIRLDHPLVALRLTVVDGQGHPVPEAQVTFSRDDGPRPGESTREVRFPSHTSAEGRVVANLEPGTWRVRVTHQGLETATTEVVLDLATARPPSPDTLGAAAETEWLQLRLETPEGPRRVLRVRVVDPQGQPIPEARVTAYSWHDATRVISSRETSDDDGRWSTEILGDGPIDLRADHRAWVGVRRELALADRLAEVVIELRRGGTLWGEIHGLEARHLEHFQVDILPADPSIRPWVEYEQGPPGVYRIYRAVGVPLDGAQLEAHLHNQALPRQFGALTFHRDGEVQRRDLHFEGGFDQEIRVTIDGEVAANMGWSVDCPGRGSTGGLAHPIEGLLVIWDMDPGECTLTLNGGYPKEHDEIVHRQTIRVTEGQGRLELELESAHFEGRLIDRRGRPVAGLELRLGPFGHPETWLGGVTTDDDGYFDFGREIRGRRLLSVFRQEDDEPLARWPIDLTGDTNLELSVPLP